MAAGTARTPILLSHPGPQSPHVSPMPHLRNLPPHAALLDVFKAYPNFFIPLIDYHQRLLREASPFTIQERELIAAYVSGINACRYCAGVHEATARAFGLDEHVMTALLADLDSAPVDGKLKPVLRYVRKLTETPSRMTERDAEEFFAAGWDDRALHDAVAICALFNCMNRLVEGFGIVASPEYYAVSAQRLASPPGYLALIKVLQPDSARSPKNSGPS